MKKVSVSLLLFFCLSLMPFTVFADESNQPSVNWIEGPQVVSVGENLAKLDLGSDYLYANKEDTIKLMTMFGNPESKAEIGSVFSKDENQTWFIIFEYQDVGHVKDDDKDKIDADDLLKSIKEGTEEQNKERKKNNTPELNILGWAEKPNYNQELHSLVWATLAESVGDTDKTINYEARILCREGYVSATLVCSEKDLTIAKPHMKNVIDKFSFVDGKKYSDYDPAKDKTAKYGLAALVVGGAIASKKGIFIVLLALLKKFGIILLAPILALFAKLRRRKKTSSELDLTADPPNPYATSNQDTPVGSNSYDSDTNNRL